MLGMIQTKEYREHIPCGVREAVLVRVVQDLVEPSVRIECQHVHIRVAPLEAFDVSTHDRVVLVDTLSEKSLSFRIAHQVRRTLCWGDGHEEIGAVETFAERVILRQRGVQCEKRTP